MISKKLLRLAVFALIVGGLAGCYLPARFDAEIDISRVGAYSIVFEGYLAEINLYKDIEERKLTKEQEAEKIERLKTDFMRDASTKEFTYFKQGHFKVKWVKEGDLLRSRMVSFVRRNENMFSIKYNKNTGEVSMRGTPISKANAQHLTDSGLAMQGELRVKTDAEVVNHNATKVKNGKGRQKIYIWDIPNVFAPAPSLSFYLR